MNADPNRDWSLAPIYSARDLAAVETDALARGRTTGYLDGYLDGKTGADIDDQAQAAAFADLAAATFDRGVPFHELAERRCGHHSPSATRAREVAAELHTLVAADARGDQR